MYNNKEISIDSYKGSEIMKGFESNPFAKIEDTIKTNFKKGLIDKDTFDKAMDELDLVKGTDPEKQMKVKKVMTEFKEGKLKSSSGEEVTDRKQAVAIAMSEAGLSKAIETDKKDKEEKKKEIKKDEEDVDNTDEGVD
jgi:hypothetical protein